MRLVLARRPNPATSRAATASTALSLAVSDRWGHVTGSPARRCSVAKVMAGRNTRRCRKRPSARRELAIASNGGLSDVIRAGALWLTGTLAVLRGGLGERLLECALASGLAGDCQLRGPGGDATGERCGAFTTRDLDWCTLTDLSEQPRAVLLR